jgi:hypothetical protein
MIFRRIAAMHQHIAARVTHQHGECPMFQATPMHLDLRGNALGDVVCVNQNDLVAVIRFARKSVQFLKPTTLAPAI